MPDTNRRGRRNSGAKGGNIPVIALLAAVVVGAVALMALILLSTGDGEPAPSRAAPARERTAEREGLAFGPADAPVTIDLYADFQCPYCGRFALEVAPQIEEEYVNTGKARLVYHNFAFLGDESQWAAEAAYCANDQDRFWEYHDKLFVNQNGENRGSFSKDRLKLFAEEIGLDMEQFNACFDAGTYRGQVEADNDRAKEADVRSTPTVFINGRRIEGLRPYDAYKEIIEEELSR